MQNPPRPTAGAAAARDALRHQQRGINNDPIRARTAASRSWRFGLTGNARAQKNVVAVVLVPLSQVIVTVQFRNFGTAGTILRSYLELAGRAKPRLKSSVVYVHCDDTPLRSVM